jgi:hypothetical protein
MQSQVFFVVLCNGLLHSQTVHRFMQAHFVVKNKIEVERAEEKI